MADFFSKFYQNELNHNMILSRFIFHSYGEIVYCELIQQIVLSLHWHVSILNSVNPPLSLVSLVSWFLEFRFYFRKPHIVLKPVAFLVWSNKAWIFKASKWRRNERDGVSNHQPHDCLLNRLSRRRSKKTSKLHVNGLCAGNSPGVDEFPAQRSSDAENVSIWWSHHGQGSICLHHKSTFDV